MVSVPCDGIGGVPFNNGLGAGDYWNGKQNPQLGNGYYVYPGANTGQNTITQGMEVYRRLQEALQRAQDEHSYVIVVDPEPDKVSGLDVYRVHEKTYASDVVLTGPLTLEEAREFRVAKLVVDKLKGKGPERNPDFPIELR